jgi:hypothetical protein
MVRNGENTRQLPAPPFLLQLSSDSKGSAFGLIEFECLGLTP